MRQATVSVSETVQIKVRAIRSADTFGGAIFFGHCSLGRPYSVLANYTLIPDPSLVEVGQRWRVTGVARPHRTKAGPETQIEADDLELVAPNGREIIEWIADSRACEGIGRQTATALWNKFDADIYQLIKTHDVTTLSTLSFPGWEAEKAHVLCNAFQVAGVADSLQWLGRLGLPRKMSRSVCSAWGARAQEVVEANPYVLSRFAWRWEQVDGLAKTRWKIAANDPRRYEAAIVEALSDFTAKGHTCLPEAKLRNRVSKLLGGESRARAAIALVPQNPDWCAKVGDNYQSPGLHVIECYLAERFHAMVAGELADGQASLFPHGDADKAAISAMVDRYEMRHKLPPFTPEQRQAVATSAKAGLSLLLGGAGTGKTTALQALYEVLETIQPGVAIFQCAPTGKAAERMAQATNRPAMTVHSLLNRIDAKGIDHGAVVVVDEASLLDILLTYRLLRRLPSGTKLILVGDPSQLLPVGPGLVLHCLAGLDTIPQVQLTLVQRQSAASGIPMVAKAIREHRVPQWAQYLGKGAGVAFRDCKDSEIERTVLETYSELGGTGNDFDVQVLGVTRLGHGGITALNTALSATYRTGDNYVEYIDHCFGRARVTQRNRVPIRVGDLIMFGKNDYDLGLRNGSLGRVLRALPLSSTIAPCCVVEFDGAEFELTEEQMESVSHAYGITVHKSQGSQFSRVIVSLRGSRLVDQALLYTAVTRGVEQVVLIGNRAAAEAAICAPASATHRHIALPQLLWEASCRS